MAVHPGMTLTWDNVGKKVTTRRPGRDCKNVYMNWALGYMAINRIPVTQFDANARVRATDIHLSHFIPGPQDFAVLQKRMEIVTGRILVENIPWFKEHMSEFVIKHIQHEHSAASSQKSVLVWFNILYT